MLVQVEIPSAGETWRKGRRYRIVSEVSSNKYVVYSTKTCKNVVTTFLEWDFWARTAMRC